MRASETFVESPQVLSLSSPIEMLPGYGYEGITGGRGAGMQALRSHRHTLNNNLRTYVFEIYI